MHDFHITYYFSKYEATCVKQKLVCVYDVQGVVESISDFDANSTNIQLSMRMFYMAILYEKWIHRSCRALYFGI